jgi:hypothetical protein
MNDSTRNNNAGRIALNSHTVKHIGSLKRDLEETFFGREGSIGDNRSYQALNEKAREEEAGGSRLKAADMEFYGILDIADLYKKDAAAALMEIKSLNLARRCRLNYSVAKEALENRESNDARYTLTLVHIDAELPSSILEREDASSFLVEKAGERTRQLDDLIHEMQLTLPDRRAF